MTKRYMLIPIASFLFNFSLLAAQNWTEMSDPVRPYVTRLDGERLTCGLATQEEMASISEALDRMPPRTPPLENTPWLLRLQTSWSTTAVSPRKPRLPFSGRWTSGQPC